MTTIRKVLTQALLMGAALCSVLPAVAAKDEGVWTKHSNLNPVTVDGKTYTAQCSGYPGTDSKFSFWSKKGKSDNVMVYFEGGGACWDGLTCSLPFGSPGGGFYSAAIHPLTDPNQFEGVFKSNNAKNPVKDWSVVYIPYCTGDLHAGSKEQTYNRFGNPAAGQFNVQHRGFDNFMVVLDWMKKNIDAPKNMLVTGVSAGGYGASINFPWLAKTYPKAKLNVLADSSQGVTVPAFDTAAVGRNSWNPQFASWVWPNAAAGISGSELLRVATQKYPEAKISQFTPSFDGVQIFFYGTMKQLYTYPGSCANPAVDWYQQMSTKLVSYASTLPNFRYYVAGGTYHTILADPGFYTENSAGPSFSEWLGDMVGNRGGRHGQGGGDWRNVACPTCLVQLPCP
jgi:Pectinacetylesterase